MDIETFRWFMSTVAQTLGALTAIVMAVYTMWIQRLRFLQEDTKEKANKYCSSNDTVAHNGHAVFISTLCNNILNAYGYNSISSFIEDISDKEIDTKDLNRQVLNDILFIRDEYQRRLKDMKDAQQIWRPIFLSMLTIMVSLISLAFDNIIIPCLAHTLWAWIDMSIVTIMIMLTLYLYFSFMFDVVAPYYPKHSRWTRFWKGLFDKDYPYNQKED